MDQQNPTTQSATPQPQSPKHNTLMAVVAYLLFFIPLLTDAKNDPFVKFHVKQGLVFFISCLAAAIIIRLPIIGWLLMFPINIFLFVIWLIGILNALSGKQKLLPVIGKYGEQFEL
ncbi:MAG TPA: hypothetical protein VLK22_01175 [Candidatus Udaeobacter sp.]|nr:hypothetical protein [Candidatus Udaeobacter sp.]